MNDLRQAAQQALEALEELDGLDTETECVTIDVGNVMDALHSALEQQAEPVAWGVDWGHNGDRSCVSIIKKHHDGTIEVIATEYDPKASTPPQRKPLTDEMRKQMKEASDSMEMRGAFANGWLSAEAAHGIKEGT